MTANAKRAATVWSKLIFAVSAVLLLGCGHREELHKADAVWSDDDSEWLVMLQHGEYTAGVGGSSRDTEVDVEIWRVPAVPEGEVAKIRSGTRVASWSQTTLAGAQLAFLKTQDVLYFKGRFGYTRVALSGESTVGAYPWTEPIVSPDGKFLAMVSTADGLNDEYRVTVTFLDGTTLAEHPALRVDILQTDPLAGTQVPMKPYVIWLNGKLYVTSERHAAAFTPPDQVEYPVEPPCWGKTKDEIVVGRATSTSDVSSTGLLVNAHAESMLIGSYDVEPKYGVKLIGYPDWCTAQK